MGIRIFVAVVLSVWIGGVAWAQDMPALQFQGATAAAQDRPEDIQAFNAGYRELQAAIAERRYRDALNAGKVAFEKAKILEGVSDHETGQIALVLARLSHALYEYDDAFEWADEGIKYLTLAHGESSEHHFQAHVDVIGMALQRLNYDIARKHLTQLDRVVSKHFDRPCRERGVWHLYSGDVYRLKFRIHSASGNDVSSLKAHYRKARSDFTAIGDFDGLGNAEFRLGKFEMENEKEHRAVKHFLAAIEAYEKAGTPKSDEDFIRARTFLSVVYSKQGKEDLATEQLLLISEHYQESDRNDIQPVYRTNPQYPEQAARRGVEGWVHLEFVVTHTGKVKDVAVLDADPPKVFNKVSIEAVSQWRYIPLRVDGELVDFKTEVVLTFNLER